MHFLFFFQSLSNIHNREQIKSPYWREGESYHLHFLHLLPNIKQNSKRLSDIGWSVGFRLLDSIVYREKGLKRETRLVNILSFIQTVVWKTLFGKTADSIEQSLDNRDKCILFSHTFLSFYWVLMNQQS